MCLGVYDVLNICLKYPMRFGGTVLRLMSLQGFINRVTHYKLICIYVYPRYCKIFCWINWIKHSFSIYGPGGGGIWCSWYEVSGWLLMFASTKAVTRERQKRVIMSPFFSYIKSVHVSSSQRQILFTKFTQTLLLPKKNLWMNCKKGLTGCRSTEARSAVYPV